MSKLNNTIKFKNEYEKAKVERWKNNHLEEVEQFNSEKISREQQRIQGKIFNHNVKNWLDGEITTARIGLIVTMILTALIKGQIVIWAILYFVYRLRVKKAKQDAIEADRRYDYK